MLPPLAVPQGADYGAVEFGAVAEGTGVWPGLHWMLWHNEDTAVCLNLTTLCTEAEVLQMSTLIPWGFLCCSFIRTKTVSDSTVPLAEDGRAQQDLFHALRVLEHRLLFFL